MHITGYFKNASYDMDGSLLLTFKANESRKALEEMASITSDTLLVIDTKKYREKRSLSANAYFWQLVDKIAKTIGSDKDTVYLMQLQRYGVFVDMTVIDEAVDTLRLHFRFVETQERADGYTDARCYLGSSKYNTKEMSDLINGTVSDAKDLNIETLTDDEIAEMMSLWRE